MPSAEQLDRLIQEKEAAAKPDLSRIDVALGEKAETTPVRDFAQQFNAQAARFMGPAVDALESSRLTGPPLKAGMTALGIDPRQGGAQEILDFWETTNLAPPNAPDRQPEGIAGHSGGFLAESLPYIAFGTAALARQGGKLITQRALPGLPAGQTPAPSAAGRTVQAAKRTAQEIGKTAIDRPGRFMTAETAAATGAGAGGGIAEEVAPGSDAARLTGELIGGLAPSTFPSPMFAALRASGQLAAKLPGIRTIVGKTFRPREVRATERVARAETDPKTAVREIDEADVLPGLSPAERSGREGLLELEKDILESSDTLRIANDERIAEVEKNILTSLESIGNKTPIEATRANAELAQGYLTNLLDTRLRIAGRRVQDRLSRLSPKASREASNRIAREELQSALKSARTQERELYRQIPMDTEVGTTNVRGAYSQALSETSKATRDDIPGIARTLLSKKGKQFLGDQTRITELRGLQSKLGETARAARGEGKFNKARIAEDLRKAINADLEAAAVGDAGEAISRAVTFSRQLNDRFSRGTTGKLLGFAREGGASVPESMTLETTLGVGNPARAKENFRQLRAAVADDPAALEGAAEDFVKSQFLRKAVPNGQFDANSARRFLNANDEFLTEFPALRRDIAQAIESEDARLILSRRSDSLGSRMRDPRISKSALLIREEPSKVFRRVRESRNPGEQMQQIINRAAADESGQAVEGLKAALIHDMLDSATQRMPEGDLILGRVLSEQVKANQPLISRLLTKEEAQRLNRAVNTATRLDLARRARTSNEGVLGDLPGQATSLMSRIFAAQAGRVLADQTGGGTVQTPGIAVGQAQNMLSRFVSDPGKRLLTDALISDDPGLLRALLMGEVKPGSARDRFVRRKLNGWAAAVAADIGADKLHGEVDQSQTDTQRQRP